MHIIHINAPINVFPQGGSAGLTGEFDIFFYSHVKFPTHSLKKHVKYPRVGENRG